MSDNRIHSCGQSMAPSMFAHNNAVPEWRSQPIWLCVPCSAWEPRDGWRGPLPEAWDGQQWTDNTDD